MQIGIVGIGKIGSTLGRLFAAAGHEVLIAASRPPAAIADSAAAIGARAVDLRGAAGAADLVVIAIPQGAVTKLDPAPFAASAEKAIIVDTGNYFPGLRDGPIAAIDGGMPDSMWVSSVIGRPVLKAFNNIGAASLANGGRPAGTAGRIALSVAGDDAAAKATLSALIDSIGFDAVDGGSLAESWRQQPGTLAFCHDLPVPVLRAAIAAGDPEHRAFYRAQADNFTRHLVAQMADAGRA